MWLLWCPSAEVLGDGCARVEGNGCGFSPGRGCHPHPLRQHSQEGWSPWTSSVTSAAPSVIKAFLNLCLALRFLTGVCSEAKGFQFNSSLRWLMLWSGASGLAGNWAGQSHRSLGLRVAKAAFRISHDLLHLLEKKGGLGASNCCWVFCKVLLNASLPLSVEKVLSLHGHLCS